MTTAKSARKNAHSLPDRRLAKLFKFSAADLAANRAGFITHAQLWRVPLWARGVLSLLPSVMRRRPPAASLCSRIRLQQVSYEIQSHFMGETRYEYRLYMNHDTVYFRINAPQYAVLTTNSHYRVYYHPQTQEILAIERQPTGCTDA